MDITEVVAKALGVDPATVTTGTGPGDLPQWDSLGHLTVIQAVESAYGVTLTVMEQMEVESVADLEELVS
jgi:acyl carrier protein